MKTCAIIAEYNPFHNGHEYLISEAKKQTGCDNVIIVMSGNFVQRGEPAIFEKHLRAKCALCAGANLVLELPVLYATGSAQYFASGAISLIEALGCVDYLCFGSEFTDTDFILKIAHIMLDESDTYKQALTDALKAGISYPVATTHALKAVIDKDDIPFVDQLFNRSNSNAILAIEYCKALLRLGSNITPVAIKRIGSAYSSLDISKSNLYSSASAIRSAILSYESDHQGSGNEYLQHIPAYSQEMVKECTAQSTQDYSLILNLKLQQAINNNHLDSFFDMPADLSHKIKASMNNYADWDSFVMQLKSKNYTHSRIMRALLHVILDISNQDGIDAKGENYPVYLMPLALRKNSDIFSTIKNTSSLPLITKVKEAESILSVSSYKLFDQTLQADLIYHAVLTQKIGKPSVSPYSIPIERI